MCQCEITDTEITDTAYLGAVPTIYNTFVYVIHTTTSTTTTAHLHLGR